MGTGFSSAFKVARILGSFPFDDTYQYLTNAPISITSQLWDLMRVLTILLRETTKRYDEDSIRALERITSYGEYINDIYGPLLFFIVPVYELDGSPNHPDPTDYRSIRRRFHQCLSEDVNLCQFMNLMGVLTILIRLTTEAYDEGSINALARMSTYGEYMSEIYGPFLFIMVEEESDQYTTNIYLAALMLSNAPISITSQLLDLMRVLTILLRETTKRYDEGSIKALERISSYGEYINDIYGIVLWFAIMDHEISPRSVYIVIKVILLSNFTISISSQLWDLMQILTILFRETTKEYDEGSIRALERINFLRSNTLDCLHGRWLFHQEYINRGDGNSFMQFYTKYQQSAVGPHEGANHLAPIDHQRIR
ncbi:unnamed protein product [Nezara viridula]|uniref:Uncharacterized protein n=1 Tax=Nezara viridula TaxID=85310 RepID=A0A9P0HMI4_NEZVI|nr:unnamed protein product [Nezara viridula]